MGCEYKITVAPASEDLSEADFILRSISQFTTFDAQHEFYEFREPSNTGKIPNIIVKIKRDGLYLCDFGSSRDLVEVILHALREQFGEVQMEDYEP